jgi:polyphosphate kinase 2 (PPK2 family)
VCRAGIGALSPEARPSTEPDVCREEARIADCPEALDAGGKDGTRNHVFTAFNPQGASVTGFKQPTPLELEHDFLWRVHPHAPPKGWVSVFNRSHYEDVLIARVHKLVDKATWTARYDRIREFETELFESETRILKFFLHISKEEQPAPINMARQLAPGVLDILPCRGPCSSRRDLKLADSLKRTG